MKKRSCQARGSDVRIWHMFRSVVISFSTKLQWTCTLLTMYLLSIHDSYYVFGTNCSIYVLVQNANGSERCEFVTNMSGLMFLVLFFLAENLKSPPLFFNVVSAIAYFSLLNTENGTKSFLQF